MNYDDVSIDPDRLRQQWFDKTVPIHDIAIDHNCSTYLVRKAAAEIGLPFRDEIMKPHGPLWEDFESEEEFRAAVLARAEWVRSKWSDEDEYNRRVVKGSGEVSIICLSDTGDASTFKPTAMPGYMTASLPSRDGGRHDRKKDNAA